MNRNIASLLDAQGKEDIILTQVMHAVGCFNQRLRFVIARM